MKKNKIVAAKGIKVWDGGTRLFHWVLVILFSLSAYSAFQDKFGIYADMHRWSGYSVLTLVSWRILWGFVGSETARFGHFLKGPSATIKYAKSAFKKAPYRWVGHNPLGAWSVLLMLVLLLAQAVMGLYATDDMIFSGPLSDTISSSLAGTLTGWHKTIGFTLFGLVGLHLLVIVLVAVRRDTNLVLPMISGHKKDAAGETAPIMRPSWLALISFFIVAGAFYWFLFQ